MLYDTVKHVILNQIRAPVFDQTIDKHIYKCCDAAKSAKLFEKRTLRNDEQRTPKASLV